MKTFDQLMQERRSVRGYAARPVAREDIETVLEAARRAPSACNAQPWRFAVITEPALKEQLIAEGLGGPVVPNAWAKSAPAIIVACSERKMITHYLAERVQGVQYHLVDMGIALGYLALKAVELGLGTCFIGWFNGRKIHRLLRLPPAWKVECLVTLGYPSAIPAETPRKTLREIAFFNTR
jgi:nitroreductase